MSGIQWTEYTLHMKCLELGDNRTREEKAVDGEVNDLLAKHGVTEQESKRLFDGYPVNVLLWGWGDCYEATLHAENGVLHG